MSAAIEGPASKRARYEDAAVIRAPAAVVIVDLVAEAEDNDNDNEINPELPTANLNGDATLHNMLNKLIFADMMTARNPTETVHALTKLCNLCYDSVKVSEQIIKLGGHTMLVALMNLWRESEGVQTECCRAIQLLICNTGSDTDMITHLFNVKALDLVVDAMAKFPNSGVLQEYGLGAIGNLFSAKEDNVPTRQAAQSFVAKDGIQLLTSIMTRFADNEDILEYGCQAFANLSEWGDFRETMLKLGVLLAVSTAHSNHSDHEGIRAEAKKCFKYIYEGDQDQHNEMEVEEDDQDSDVEAEEEDESDDDRENDHEESNVENDEQ